MYMAFIGSVRWWHFRFWSDWPSITICISHCVYTRRSFSNILHVQNRFLYSRVVEFRARGHSTRASIVLGMGETGGIITAAGVVMAVAFGGLMLSATVTLQEVYPNISSGGGRSDRRSPIRRLYAYLLGRIMSCIKTCSVTQPSLQTWPKKWRNFHAFCMVTDVSSHPTGGVAWCPCVYIGYCVPLHYCEFVSYCNNCDSGWFHVIFFGINWYFYHPYGSGTSYAILGRRLELVFLYIISRNTLYN